MDSLLKQIKTRRQALELKQHDMMLRVGISRQQYQRLESKGNPRLDTLELVAKGLRSKLLLIPQEKLKGVLAILSDEHLPSIQANPDQSQTGTDIKNALADDPWHDLLGEYE